MSRTRVENTAYMRKYREKNRKQMRDDHRIYMRKWRARKRIEMEACGA